MRRIHIKVKSLRRQREELEKAERTEAHRLKEINEKLSALTNEKEETMLRGVELGVQRQDAVDAEARLQHEWKGLGPRRRGHSKSWRRQSREYKRRGKP
jgi:hypothetical protein